MRQIRCETCLGIKLIDDKSRIFRQKTGWHKPHHSRLDNNIRSKIAIVTPIWYSLGFCRFIAIYSLRKCCVVIDLTLIFC